MGLVMDVVVVVPNVGWPLLDVEGDDGPVATFVRGIIPPFGAKSRQHVMAFVAVPPPNCQAPIRGCTHPAVR